MPYPAPALRNLLRAHPVACAFAACIACVAIVRLPMLQGGGPFAQAALRLVLAAGVLGLIALAGPAGARVAIPSSAGFGRTLRKAAYLLAIALVIAVSTWFSHAGETFVPGWPVALLGTVVLCAAVGIFEEALFRGLLLGGLLARMGATRRGIAGAAVLSSLAFGAAHVLPDLIGIAGSGFSGEGIGLMAAQAALKTLQAGIAGLFFATVFLTTRNLWAIAAVHALYDGLPMAVSSLFPAAEGAAYVSADPTVAAAAILVYALMLVALIPLVVSSVRTLRRVAAPDRGLAGE